MRVAIIVPSRHRKGERSLQEGVVDYLVKPIKPEKFTAVMVKAVKQHELLT